MVENEIAHPQLPPAHTAALLSINGALAQTTDGPAFIQQALGELSALLGPACAVVLLLGQDGADLTVASAAPQIPPTGALALESRPAVAAALGAPQPVLHLPPDTAALATELGSLVPAEPAALLWVPLTRQAQPIGALLL